VAENQEACGETMRALFDLYAKGMIRPRISRRVPLERGAEALALLQAREAVGKIVVVPG
jgi:NADPH2:quinone reductase